MIAESLKYSIPYLLLISFLMLLFVIEYMVRKQETDNARNLQIVRWASFGSILFFFGFRGFVGWDWIDYYPSFNNLPTLFSLSHGAFERTRFENGFAVYSVLIKTIWNNYHFFIFINTLTDLLLLYAFVKQFARFSFSLSCLVFIAFGGFYLEVDLLRNAKSILLFALSLKYLKERNALMYFALNAIGCLFHLSAVLYLPLYFFLHKLISRRNMIIIFIAGLAIFVLQIEYTRPFLHLASDVLGEKFRLLLDKYLKIEMYSTAYGFTIGFVERVITAFLVIKYYYVLIEKDRTNIIFINSFMLFFILFMYFAEINVIPVRVGGLFSLSYWILYPAIFNAIQKRNNKIIFLSYIFTYTIIKITGITDNIFYRYISVIFSNDDVSSRISIYERFKDFFLNQ